MKFFFPKKQIKFFLIFAGILFFANNVEASSLYLSPSSGSYTAGNSFSVKIIVSSADQSANAVSGSLFFPKDKVEVTSISKVGSVINFWVQEPIFSNNSGSINFEGLILNPGFTGSYGEVITVNFRAKTVGEAKLGFSEGVVLANDGLGTNILDTLGTADFIINASVAGPGADNSSTPSVALGTPQAVVISSPTHPASSDWYSKDDAKFTWNPRDGVTATKLLIGKNPTSIPTVLYTDTINEKTIKDLEDGVWYFHVQEKNSSGWGAVSHFKVQVDTTPPKPFNLEFKKEANISLQPLVVFTTNDTLSGIDYYDIKVDGNDSIKIEEIDSSKPFLIPIQKPGKHLVVVEAFDKAGNSTIASGEFETTAIDSPTILDYPYNLSSKDTLIIKGKTYPDSKIEAFLEDENGNITQQDLSIGKDGDFVLVWSKKINFGIYKFRAVVIDKRGARSYPSEDIIISVDNSFWGLINSMAVYILSMIGIVGIVLIFVFVMLNLWYRFKRMKKRLSKEIEEVDVGIEKAFRLLKEDVKEHIVTLSHARSKRDLTAEETKILKDLMKNFNDAEKYLKKEVKDVKKEIKINGKKIIEIQGIEDSEEEKSSKSHTRKKNLKRKRTGKARKKTEVTSKKDQK